jgi:uncharacterized protein (TIGR02452 family)
LPSPFYKSFLQIVKQLVHGFTGCNAALADKRVTALSFASAKNPGVGFLTGAQPQEVSLARASGLYAILLGDPMYDRHRSLSDPLYTSWVVYPRGVRAGSDTFSVGHLLRPGPNPPRRSATDRMRIA